MAERKTATAKKKTTKRLPGKAAPDQGAPRGKNQSARARVTPSDAPAAERRPGTEVWMVVQENAWEADDRGLPPRRGSR